MAFLAVTPRGSEACDTPFGTERLGISIVAAQRRCSKAQTAATWSDHSVTQGRMRWLKDAGAQVASGVVRGRGRRLGATTGIAAAMPLSAPQRIFGARSR
jgi:hypothetical protein